MQQIFRLIIQQWETWLVSAKTKSPYINYGEFESEEGEEDEEEVEGDMKTKYQLETNRNWERGTSFMHYDSQLQPLISALSLVATTTTT